MISQHYAPKAVNPAVLAKTLLNIGTVTPEMRVRLGRSPDPIKTPMQVEANRQVIYEAYLLTKEALLDDAETLQDRRSVTDNKVYAAMREAMDAGEIPMYSKVTFYAIVNDLNTPIRRAIYDAALALVDRFCDLHQEERIKTIHEALVPIMDNGDLDYVHLSGLYKILKEFGQAPFTKPVKLGDLTSEDAFVREPAMREANSKLTRQAITNQYNQEILKVFATIKEQMTVEAIKKQNPRRITNNRVYGRMELLMQRGECRYINKSGLYRLLNDRKKTDAKAICASYARAVQLLTDKQEPTDAASVYKRLRVEMIRGHLPFYAFRAVVKMVNETVASAE